MTHEIIGVFHPPGPPQRAAVQRSAQLAVAKFVALLGDRDRLLDQAAVHVVGDQQGAKSNQRSLAEGRLRLIEAVQDQLPAPIHHRRLDDLVVGDASVGLEDRRQRQLGRRDRRLSHPAVFVEGGEFLLEGHGENRGTLAPQKHEKLRPPNAGHHYLLAAREGRRRLPYSWSHAGLP